MSVLHVLRDGADPHAGPVIRAQAAQGVPLTLLVLGGAGSPGVDAPCYAVAPAAPQGAETVDWPRALELIFAADTVVTW